MTVTNTSKSPWLEANGTHNPYAQRVNDALFQEQAFFDPEDALQEYLNLRNTLLSAQIATQGDEQTPESSYAPFVWFDGCIYLFLSELARHTQNLRRDPAIGLMLIEDEAQARNPFSRRRIYLQGKAMPLLRDHESFAPVLAEFHQRFGAVMEVIEPLPDFHLFRVNIFNGRFILGFGQAYLLSGDDLDQLEHIDPRQG